MIFVDASALVSLAAQEEDALDLAGVLESDPARLTSPIALWAATTPRSPSAAAVVSVPVLIVCLSLYNVI